MPRPRRFVIGISLYGLSRPPPSRQPGNVRLMTSVCLSDIIFAIVTAKNIYFRRYNGRSYVTAFAVPLSSLRRPRGAPAWRTARRADPHFGPTSSPPSDDRSRGRVLPRHSTRPVLQTSVFRIPIRILGVTPHYLSKKKTVLSFLECLRRHSLKTQAAQGFERYKRIA